MPDCRIFSTMKNYSLFLLFFFIFFAWGTTHAQHVSPCAFDEVNQKEHLHSTNQKIQASLLNNLPERNTHRGIDDSVRTIPVVVHVIHDGWTENISNAQIESQINILNEDYGKLPGSNGDGAGVDTRIQFKLAQLSPEGHCTDGIVRIRSPLTDHQTFERSKLRELSFWDNERYLNIYVVKYISGTTLGYSSFPGGPPDEDGIVIKHNVFGNTGTALNSLGRTLTHEIGHWFGLYHTFNNGCGTDVCLDGDYVCDTPPQHMPNFSCSILNTCSIDVPDVSDQRENYMNYTPDNCKNMFTAGQKDRMDATLDTIRTIISSAENLIATGCNPEYSPPFVCSVVADFVTLTKEICKGNTVRFMDISLNNATSWQWTFPGGIPSTSNAENPEILYPEPGTYMVKLVVADGITMDSVIRDEYVVVVEPGIGDPINYMENFDQGVFPSNGMTIINQDEGITWELDSLAFTSPPSSVRINNLINTNYGSIDEIVLPHLDFTGAPADADISMRFNWAYAKSDASFSDELIVLLSTDCGSTWQEIFYRNQEALATGPTQTTPFIPDSSQWKSADIDLNLYRDERFVQIKIINVTDGGNNLYLDDINVEYSSIMTSVSHPENPLSDLQVYPNPFSDQLIIQYKLDQPIALKISVTDLTGRRITHQSFNKGHSVENTISIDSASWADGMYLMTITTDVGIHTLKLIKGQ